MLAVGLVEQVYSRQDVWEMETAPLCPVHLELAEVYYDGPFQELLQWIVLILL